MKKSNFDLIVQNRLLASDFAQAKKVSTIAKIWRKLCAVTKALTK